MTQPAPPQWLRIKIPCGDEREFRKSLAPKYVSTGILVPSKEPRPVGTRFRVKLELRTGQILVSGDAIVTRRTPAGGSAPPGMTLRFTALHPESIQFELSPTAFAAAARAPASPAPTPVPPRSANLDRLFEPDDQPESLADAGEAVEPRRTDATAGLSELDPTPQPVPARSSDPFAASTGDPRNSDDAMVARAAVAPPVLGDAVAPPASPEATTSHHPERRRIAIWIAAGSAVVAAVAAVTVIGMLRVARPRDRDAPAGARVAEELRIADLRLQEGRLAGAGGDSALDHILAARAVAPDDARVTTRIGLLADKFEELGERALARKNLREARVHYEAAVRADPGREGARRKLAEMAALPDGAAPAR